MSNSDELKSMLLTFRVSELQMLLGYAGLNKTGRKTELQSRAVELLKNKSVPHLTQIHAKIRELYKTIEQGGSVQQNKQAVAAQAAVAAEAASMVPTQQQRPLIPPTPPQLPPQAFIPLSTRPSLYGSLYGYHQGKLSAQQSAVYPIIPDVRFKRLPFYDILGELLKPSSLVPNGSSRAQEGSFVFYLTPQQATEVAMNREIGPGTKNEYLIQVQLRFCLMETSCEQDDLFPPGVGVKVNGKPCPLPNPIPTNKPGVEPKRPPRPVNISPLVKLSPSVSNHITINWNTEYARGYVISINLVRKLTAVDLLQRLKSKGIRHADFTTGLIKEKLSEDNDSEIATTSLRVSLLCPLGKMRMTSPARSTTCTHLQCFDASLFLQMNEKKATWTCPVCDKAALYDNLVIDGYFQDVLSSNQLARDSHEIQLHKDGSWSSHVSKKESTCVLSPAKTNNNNANVANKVEPIEEILDDSDEGGSSSPLPVKKSSSPLSNGNNEERIQETLSTESLSQKKKEVITIDLTISSDSEDESDSVGGAVLPADNGNGGTHDQQSSQPSKNQDGLRRSELVGGSDLSLRGEDSSSPILSMVGSPGIITLDSPSPSPPPSSYSSMHHMHQHHQLDAQQQQSILAPNHHHQQQQQQQIAAGGNNHQEIAPVGGGTPSVSPLLHPQQPPPNNKPSPSLSTPPPPPLVHPPLLGGNGGQAPSSHHYASQGGGVLDPLSPQQVIQGGGGAAPPPPPYLLHMRMQHDSRYQPY